MIYIWIASHIDSLERLEMLKLTLDSVSKQKIDLVVISISFERNLNLDSNIVKLELLEFIKNITFIFVFSEVKLKQFEHYRKIYELYKDEQNNRVIFLDDDDLLLSLPDEYDSDKNVLSKQYINKTYEQKYFNVDQINSSDKSKFHIDIDFSGCSCLIFKLESYFNLKSDIIADSLEDTKFMKFLQNDIHLIPETPFIFHRVWYSSCTWKTDLLNQINKMKSDIKRLSNVAKESKKETPDYDNMLLILDNLHEMYV